ncbi:Transthyretin-like family protein [Oesophagostomum dentatum]|uniref:Transthyretin-like family protein n=1 Tax=Oesophagostomum dentatum TaxID=61180 RepID=A0A0B1SG32_OESDE|nr:Transthyretin-like family protein [Oesophagostomum dentatum]
MQTLIALLALGLCFVSTMAKMQNVTVKGTTVCHRKRVPNVHVQLYDRDTLDPNDLLAEMHTNSEGEFELFGQEDEVRRMQFSSSHIAPNSKTDFF